MPRAALLSIHARVAGTEPSTWEDPSLVQLWGPQFSVFVVAARDRAVFSLGTLPDDAKGRQRAEDRAARLGAFLGGARMSCGEAGRALGVHPNSFRFGAPIGTILIRWDGARRPAVWTVPRPEVDPRGARLELARRYLHIYGPAAPEAFGWWAGIGSHAGQVRVRGLRRVDQHLDHRRDQQHVGDLVLTDRRGHAAGVNIGTITCVQPAGRTASSAA